MDNFSIATRVVGILVPMSTRVPLPESICSRPFTVAEGSAVGVGEGRLRGNDLARPFHGVRVPNVAITTVEERCAAYFPRLKPGQFFSHTTAAALWELPLPSPPTAAENIHVSAVYSARAPSTRGVTGHQLSASTSPETETPRWPLRKPVADERTRTPEPGRGVHNVTHAMTELLDGHELQGSNNTPREGGSSPDAAHRTAGRGRIVRLRGLPVADPISVFLSLAQELPLNDLIALGDAIVRGPAGADRLPAPDGDDSSPATPRSTAAEASAVTHLTEHLRPYATLAELRARISAHSGKGKRAAVAALPLIRTGVASRPETLLRLLLSSRDLPRPRLGLVIRDTTSAVIARAAIAYPEWWVIVEYDGEHALSTPLDRANDLERFERLMNAGWTVIRVRPTGLFRTPESTLSRVASTLRSVGWRRA